MFALTLLWNSWIRCGTVYSCDRIGWAWHSYITKSFCSITEDINIFSMFQDQDWTITDLQIQFLRFPTCDYCYCVIGCTSSYRSGVSMNALQWFETTCSVTQHHRYNIIFNGLTSLVKWWWYANSVFVTEVVGEELRLCQLKWVRSMNPTGSCIWSEALNYLEENQSRFKNWTSWLTGCQSVT